MAKVGFWLRGSKGKLAGASMGKGADGSTVIREIVTPSNPKTAAQALQRMKLGPAAKFYNTFSELLSNAFEAVSYGGDSRRYFMAKVMKLDGPYIQKSVDRFIPAAYPFSEGSLPSVGIEPFSGGTSVITLGVTTDQAEVTPELLAQLLQVTTDYQITIAVVNNVNGLFKPSYISYDKRLTIAEIPEGALGKNENNQVTISPAAFGLDASALVAMCVVLSTQDASGNWLRSSQDMIISEELRSAIYSADAMEAAIYSYQDNNAANTINSEWYFNLGMAQSWPGKLTTSNLMISEDGSPANADVIVGIQQLDGRIKRTVFVTALTDDGLIVCLENGKVTTYPDGTVGDFKGYNIGYDYQLWQDSYATQLGIYDGSPIAPTPTPTPSTNACFYRDVTLGPDTYHALVDEFGRLLVKKDDSNVEGFAWNENGVADSFDNVGRFSEVFIEIRSSWGQSNVIIDHTGNTVIFRHDDEVVTLNYSSNTGNVVPTVSQLTDGTPNMFYRTLNDGTNDIDVVCDADGKLCVIDGTDYIQKSEDEFITVNDSTKLAALSTAAGGTTAVTAEESSDTNMTKITNGNYFFVFNMDGYITFGSVNWFVTAELEGGGEIIPESVEYMAGTAEQEGETYYFSQVPVVVAKDGTKHIIKCTATSSKYYGLYLSKNAPGWDNGVWWTAINVEGADVACLTSSYMKDSFVTWLIDNGITPQIYWDHD